MALLFFVRLAPVFQKEGLVTAANASGISDGAGALVVAGEEAIKEHSLKPLARLVSWSRVGCDPTIMGIGPVEAIRGALKASQPTHGR
jgi:acetyl-CoA acyltransferase 2